MAKTMPKYMVDKINRMNDLIEAAKKLNIELEQWLEENGVTDYGFDYTYDYRYSPAYEIEWVDSFVAQVNEDLAMR